MRYSKGSDGKYHIGGRTYDMLVGSRAQVWHGTAYKTSHGRVKSKGGDALTKRNLKMNKHGRIVSADKSGRGKMLLKRLHNKGYFTRKGKFGYVRRSARRRRGSTKRVTIRERRNRRSGRFSRGGRR
jgi:hypothetical protein